MDNLIEAYNWAHQNRRMVSAFVVLFGFWSLYMVIRAYTSNKAIMPANNTWMGVILVMAAVCIWVGLAVLFGWT